MITPKRIQLSRKAGFKLQAVSLALNGLPAVNCARPTRWGNPHIVGFCPLCGVTHTQAGAVARHRAEVLANREHLQSAVASLRGNNLACWCAPGEPCHVDALLEIANSDLVAIRKDIGSQNPSV